MAVPAELGLRERKKQQTRKQIFDAAHRLFKKRGFDSVTVAEIAREADVSEVTVFNYFPTKEDLVIFDRYDPIFESFLMEMPNDGPPSRSIERALTMLAGAVEADRETVLVRATLGLEIPEVRARFWGELEKAQNLFAGLIAKRTGRDALDFEVRVLAMVLVTASFEASVEWIRRGGAGDLFELVKKALDVSGVLARLDSLSQPTRPAS